MSSRNANRDSPPSTPHEAGSLQERRGAELPNDAGTDRAKVFDPYRFQANTMPPGLREEILAAKPQPVPEERFEDTVPPNVVLGDPRDTDEGRYSSLDERQLSDGRSDPTLIIRRPGRASRLPWLLGASAALIAFALIVLLSYPRTGIDRDESAKFSATEAPGARGTSNTSNAGPSPHASEGQAMPPAGAAPATVTSHAVPLPAPTVAKRATNPSTSGSQIREKPSIPSVTSQPRVPPSGTRTGAFATPLAPPDK